MTDIGPVLLGAFFVTSATLLLIRPTNVVQSFLHQSSFYNKLSHHTLCRSHVLCRPFLPIDWLVSKASSSHPAGRPPSLPRPPAIQKARCATARDARISGLTHYCCCWSSHLSPWHSSPWSPEVRFSFLSCTRWHHATHCNSCP